MPRTVKVNLKELRCLHTLTLMSNRALAKHFGVSMWVIAQRLTECLTPEQIEQRSFNVRSVAQSGVNNPMYKTDVKVGGYVLVDRPTWFTGGKKKNLKVLKHQVVMCILEGITEIPKGMCVHHIDHNPLNNNCLNLQLMTNSDHISHHHRAAR